MDNISQQSMERSVVESGIDSCQVITRAAGEFSSSQNIQDDILPKVAPLKAQFATVKPVKTVDYSHKIPSTTKPAAEFTTPAPIPAKRPSRAENFPTKV